MSHQRTPASDKHVTNTTRHYRTPQRVGSTLTTTNSHNHTPANPNIVEFTVFDELIATRRVAAIPQVLVLAEGSASYYTTTRQMNI